MLQRDRNVKKACDIRQLLERRLTLWKDDKFDVLLQEACRCNKALKSRVRRPGIDSHCDRVFSRLMMQGKIRAAVRWITERSGSGQLAPTDEITERNDDGSTIKKSVVEVLKSKHPDPQPPHTLSLLIVDEIPHFEDIEITGAVIHKVFFGIQGGAGPGGTDAGHWHDSPIASLSRTMANEFVTWKLFKAVLANRLIALNKNPGVRPIGNGETLRRIIGKAICYVSRDDVEVRCGTEQLCAGVRMGIEAAFHTVHELFEENANSDWGLLTIDTSNAFNSLNTVALLWNARILWPTAARFIFNTYQGWSALVLRDSSTNLASMEGVTQGGPISMFLYAVGSVPLMHHLMDAT
uniref:Reverse transcriptase domain-containing protein n=1 Tax=Amphimedon queenslandica TaxID=400682 RepID=A0A1X7U8J9_AMPQE